ncbi:MAG: hypothetical protein JW726_08425 [Anaerolineales bacterium]|nr:hypothetical protein [Anaerolineales bacterium]
MLRRVMRWLVSNISALLLAFILAVIVWVSAVLSADPNLEHPLDRNVPIELIGQDPGLQLMGNPSLNAALVLKAPSSVWNQLESDQSSVRAWVDLTGLGAGEHTVEVQVQVGVRMVRLLEKDPTELTLTLEPLVTQTFPLTLIVRGEPPTGYQKDTPLLDPMEVTVSGPQSAVSRVSEVRVTVDISGASATVTKNLTPSAVDAEGKSVGGVTIAPDTISVTQPIILEGGFRYVIVRAVTAGQVTNGFRLTNIYVAPVGVVVFSSDPQIVNDLPGYVETVPIDLTDSDDDFEVLVDLDLPPGTSVVGDPKVLVQVSIAAIESSLAISLPLEIVGLTPGLEATIAPVMVDVILAGPVPVLDGLEPNDIRVKVDLTNYEPGIYQLAPVVDFLPEQVYQVTILPATVSVIVTLMPTPTPTPTPIVTPTPTPTPTPLPTARP